MAKKNNSTLMAIIAAAVAVVVIFAAGMFWMASGAARDTEEAVRSVSLLYLDELAGRREQVVASNLQDNIDKMNVAIELMDEEDLSDLEHLQAYQARMKRLYTLEKFAFVDSKGAIYTALGMQDNIADYHFDYQNITEPEISVLNLDSRDKKVVIAIPVNIPFNGETLKVCFMEIDMDEMLSGVSMYSDREDATYCNIYTSTGIALSDTVLGGLAVEDNLLEAMEHAQFEPGYSYDDFVKSFGSCQQGNTSFTYNGIRETLSYTPVKGTDWQLTYLIRESVISEQIMSITAGIIRRSMIQCILIVCALLAMFYAIIKQHRRNSALLLQQQTTEAENRARQEELERRLALQEELLQQERAREQQSEMITALASDYWSVYYLDLDKDEGVCYQVHTDLDEPGFALGEHFRYLESVTAYANRYVTDAYREEFLSFIQPEAVKAGLKENRVISYRYMVHRHNRDSYEMVRFAGVRHPEDRDDHLVHNVGACFTDVDVETRKQIAQSEALSDALELAEKANKAKTSFLSNMSHEIRTPMNAIIGLDTIALNDPAIPDKTKDYLEKIGASADHLLNLINDILDMSRIESGRMVLKNEEFSFPKMLDAINTMFSSQCQESGLDYQCHISGHVDDYYIGDGMKLRQVLINILSNAVKFTPEGGSVEFNVERMASFDGQTTMRFTISDTGIGMSEEFLPHIFDTFAQEDSSATNKYGSSGLGLAITKNIVEMMNGSIEVKSKKGEGTTFYVTVTLGDSTRSRDEDQDEVPPHEMSVLIVDDDPVACEHAKLVLEMAGISSEIAESGAKAIEMVQVRQARQDPYNLILVDWKMPDIDGVETTRRIREIVGNLSAIIILTAYRWDDIIEEATAAGVDCFIPKPLFAATVIDEFNSAVKRKGLSRKKEEHRADLTGRRILLAEDIEINAEIMVMVLEMRDVQTDLAENGKVAVDMFAQSPEGTYDAILMDVRMPEMDGLEATRVIRAMDRADARKVPIIALTANAFDEDVQRSLQSGMNAHLSKPVPAELLYDTLETLIQD